VLKAEVTAHRLEFLTQIIRLLLAMVPQQRELVLRAEAAEYCVDTTFVPSPIEPNPDRLVNLLQEVPLS
jgi:hypothetical protein